MIINKIYYIVLSEPLIYGLPAHAHGFRNTKLLIFLQLWVYFSEQI